ASYDRTSFFELSYYAPRQGLDLLALQPFCSLDHHPSAPIYAYRIHPDLKQKYDRPAGHHFPECGSCRFGLHKVEFAVLELDLDAVRCGAGLDDEEVAHPNSPFQNTSSRKRSKNNACGAFTQGLPRTRLIAKAAASEPESEAAGESMLEHDE